MSRKTRKQKHDLQVSSAEDLLVDTDSLKEILDQRFSSCIREIKEFIIDQINGMKDELKQIKEEFKSLQNSQQFLSNGFDDLKNICENLSVKVEDLSQENSDLKANIASMAAQFEGLDQGQEDIRKYLRRNTLEIQGIPISKPENTDQIIKDVGNLIGVQVEDADISISHRVPSRNKRIPPPIVVQFSRRNVRDSLLRGKKSLKSKFTTDLGYKDKNRIYINESLTPRSKELFKEIRSYQKTNELKSCWTFNGRVFLQESDGSDKKAFDSLAAFYAYKDDDYY